MAKCLRTVSLIVAVWVSVHGTPLPAAPSVKLAWNPSPGNGITGYKVYYGTSSHNYTNMVSVDNSATATLSGLTEGTTYFFAVTAVSTLGMESGFSNEISYTVPVTRPSLQPLISPGKQVVLRITGPPGRTYEIQATENLTDWTTVSVVALGPAGAVDFIDPTATGRPSRSYRLRELSRPRLQLLPSPGRPAALRITAQPDRAYEVQATQNFTTWTVVGVVASGPGGLVDFIDPTAAGRPSRFYRLREIPRPSLQLLISPSKQVVLRVTGQPGRTYEIQATQDFKTWTVIRTVPLGTGVSVDASDGNASARSSRFYRLREILN